MTLRIKRTLGNFLSLTLQVWKRIENPLSWSDIDMSKEFKWKQVTEQGMASTDEMNIEEEQLTHSLIAFSGDNMV